MRAVFFWFPRFREHGRPEGRHQLFLPLVTGLKFPRFRQLAFHPKEEKSDFTFDSIAKTSVFLKWSVFLNIFLNTLRKDLFYFGMAVRFTELKRLKSFLKNIVKFGTIDFRLMRLNLILMNLFGAILNVLLPIVSQKTLGILDVFSKLRYENLNDRKIFYGHVFGLRNFHGDKIIPITYA